MLNICKCSSSIEDLFKKGKNSKCRCEGSQANPRAPDIPLHQNVLQGQPSAGCCWCFCCSHPLRTSPRRTALLTCHTQNTSPTANNFPPVKAGIKPYQCCYPHRCGIRRKIKGSTYPCLPNTWVSMSSRQLWKHGFILLLTLLLQSVAKTQFNPLLQI